MANVKGILVATEENPTVTGKVRIGDVSPAFPPVRDRPINVSDSRKVRIGDIAPAFPPLRSR